MSVTAEEAVHQSLILSLSILVTVKSLVITALAAAAYVAVSLSDIYQAEKGYSRAQLQFIYDTPAGYWTD